MKRTIATLACAVAIALGSVGTAMAQPVPTPSQGPATTTVTTESDDRDTQPWWRLSYGVPLAGLAGAGAIVVRRVLQRRGVVGG